MAAFGNAMMGLILRMLESHGPFALIDFLTQFFTQLPTFCRLKDFLNRLMCTLAAWGLVPRAVR